MVRLGRKEKDGFSIWSPDPRSDNNYSYPPIVSNKLQKKKNQTPQEVDSGESRSIKEKKQALIKG